MNFGPRTRELSALGDQVKKLIARAEADGLTIDDGNVVDLILDNCPEVSIREARKALVAAGLASRFPRAAYRESAS